MKKIWIGLIIFVLVLGFAAKYMIDRSMIFTGFAAKNLASGIFVAERTQESLEAEDLNFSFVGLAESTVDYENKTVCSDFYGFGKQKAIYRVGLGVCLEEAGKYPDAYKQSQKLRAIPQYFENIKWPKGDKVNDDYKQYFDTIKLNKVLESTFEKGNTRALVIAYDTLGFFEKYAEGYTQNSKMLGWSMSKSVTNAMIGILARKGLLDINQAAPIDEWKNDERKVITTKSLLTMTSGLDWVEDYGDISQATIMLYEKSNHAAYAIQQKAVYPPDSVYYYSSGNSNILTEIVKRKINNDAEYWQFPYEELFYKISMFQTLMETDASGNFVGSSYTYGTARDWARFGLLYLHHGIWFGDTILTPDWVKFTQEEAPNSNGDYGAQFWINKSGRELPDAPKDIYFADGYQGQRIYICPSQKLVIVRMGMTQNMDFDYNKMVVGIIAALK